MAKSLLDLANRMDKLAGELPKEASRISISVAQTIVGYLANITPVDTSQALSNWQTSVGYRVGSSIKPYYPGEHGSTQKASAQATIAAAKESLSTKKPGQTIVISNVLPYIQKLNEGSSKQHPGGFVESGILLGRKQIEKVTFKGLL